MVRNRLLGAAVLPLLTMAFAAPAQADASASHESDRAGLATVRVPATGVFHCAGGVDYAVSTGQLVIKQRDTTNQHGRDVLVRVETSHVTARGPHGRVYTISGGFVDAVHYAPGNASDGTSPTAEFFVSAFSITARRGHVVGRVHVRYTLRPDGTSTYSDTGTCSAPTDAG